VEKRLTVVFVAAEGVPYSKTGGLADVIGVLPGAIAAQGHDVRLFLPYYAETRRKAIEVKETGVGVAVPVRGWPVQGTLLQTQTPAGVTVYFIRKDEYYDRDGLYRTVDGDYSDNAERFMFFCRAVAEALEALHLRPDVVHCHDWQTGLVPALVRHCKPGDFLARVATAFTVHNLAYQGVFWHHDMPMTGLPWSAFTPEGLEFFGKINLLKAGMVYADVVSTVSRKYSKEIQTPEFDCGLDGVLRARRNDVFGILNGADYTEWDPATDTLIAANYSRNDMAGKTRCRADLLKTYGLDVPDDVPILGMVPRLTDQKGLDIVSEALEEIIRLGTCFVLVGAGEKKYHDLLKALAKRHPDRVGVQLNFDNVVAHKIEAGADMYLMPSRFEPCGLNQMYSLKYGTVPIVRATGGLDDTITNFDPIAGTGNGFKFAAYSSRALLGSVREAVRVFRNRRLWSRVVANGMACDFSWDVSARRYVGLYRTAIERHAHRIEK